MKQFNRCGVCGQEMARALNGFWLCETHNPGRRGAKVPEKLLSFYNIEGGSVCLICSHYRPCKGRLKRGLPVLCEAWDELDLLRLGLAEPVYNG